MSNGLHRILAVREYEANGETKTSYTRVGVAFPLKNKPGFSCAVEAFPVSGKFIIVPDDGDERGGQRGAPGAGAKRGYPSQDYAKKGSPDDDMPF